MKCMFYEDCKGKVSFLRWLVFFFGYVAMCKECREGFLHPYKKSLEKLQDVTKENK